MVHFFPWAKSWVLRYKVANGKGTRHKGLFKRNNAAKQGDFFHWLKLKCEGSTIDWNYFLGAVENTPVPSPGFSVGLAGRSSQLSSFETGKGINNIPAGIFLHVDGKG
jgi:hypothetical protein